MIAPPRRLAPLVLILVGACITIFFYRSSIGDSISSHTPSLSGASLPWANVKPANATLGFGGLFVVSGPGSPRRAHLEQAAAVTELKLTIPTQKQWTDKDVSNFRVENETESKIGMGSVKAWLSHHLVLQAFLDSGLETALIFEDDVDWDIRLRTQQVPLAQQAARKLTKSSAPASVHPWGGPSTWDLLYLGHCGDYLNPLGEGVGVGHHHPSDLAKLPHEIFADPTMPERTDLHPFTASLLTSFNIPDKSRVLHNSKWPLCTFGYAINRASAHKIMTDVAPAKETREGSPTAYDAALLGGCRDNYKLNCYSMLPELFHHMEGTSMIAKGEEEASGKQVFRPPVDVAGFEQVWYRMETSNIGCGFWSGEFYYDDEPEKLEILRDEVGRKGRCIKEGRQ